MRLLLVSTYELGHQPLHLASPAAALEAAGHEVRCLDLSVQPWDPGAVTGVEGVAFSVPMHTAMRLVLPVARELRRTHPDVPTCFYGLYAPVSRDHTVGALADRVIAGEYEPGLVAWADELRGGAEGSAPSVVHLGRSPFRAPARRLLPSLERYARLAVDGEERPVGYVEASHGCAFRCRHCPVPAVYDGRTRVVPVEVVVEDVAGLVAAGARHVTFGDPDFLGSVHHGLRVVRAVHDRFPHLTFDLTTKVELVLRHRRVWPELAAAGCLFVVSAFEHVDDGILARLDKGHTTADAAEAVSVLRAQGIEPRPSFMPFTPWTTRRGLVDLVDFVAAHDLVGNVDPVQYTIRLLLPEGSLLLDHPDLAPHLGPYDAERLTWTWRSPDPALDELQGTVAARVAQATTRGEPPGATYLAVARAFRQGAAAAGHPDPSAAGRVAGGDLAAAAPKPRLTEPWFC